MNVVKVKDRVDLFGYGSEELERRVELVKAAIRAQEGVVVATRRPPPSDRSVTRNASVYYLIPALRPGVEDLPAASEWSP